jgi:HEAT repeat protein
MPLTMADVTSALAPDEPDYLETARTLGVDAAPFLEDLAAGADPALAARAASLAAYLPVDVAVPILTRAAAHPQPAVRVAAAATLGVLGEAAREPAVTLLADADVSVRSWTLRALERIGVGPLRDQVTAVATTDPEPTIRAQAARLASSS